jgi:hypothetical protein
MNQTQGGGVLLHDVVDGHSARWSGRHLSVDEELDRDFEARLIETSTLAFRIAYSVLRQR